MGTVEERIAELEWANYAATGVVAEVTPDLEVVLREDVILARSAVLPTQDANHACLVRTTTGSTDSLIGEVVDFFQAAGTSAAIYLSPACTPGDLSDRLLRRGFSRHQGEEAWMVIEGLPEVDMPSPYPGITVKPITPPETGVFAEIFLSAFDMPGEFTPVMVRLLQPSVGLPTVRHYLAWNEEQAVGTCSLVSFDRFGVLGSVGVLSSHRRSGAATSLVVHALKDASAQGVDTVMLQTAAGTPLERLLRISGFRRIFTRSCYVLENGSPG